MKSKIRRTECLKATLLFLLFFVALLTHAQNLTLVSDCYTGHSYPSELTEFNNKIYFIARSKNSAGYYRLFSSDGVLASTSQVGLLDANPYNVSNLVKTDNYLFFSYNDGVHGEEIWKSDGTAAGTSMIKDINVGNAGADGSTPGYLTVCNNKVFFIAYAPQVSLWVTDGTEAGTIQLVAHPYVHTLNSNTKLAVLNNEVYFNSGDNTTAGLYKSDGTVAGTTFVKSCVSNTSVATLPQGFAELNNVLYFTAEGRLSNGASDGSSYEIWRTDGTSAGTYIVKDVNPTGGSFPDRYFAFNNKLYFTATGSQSQGEELWATDGTGAGTYLVKDIIPGSTSSYIRNFINYGQLYFFITNGNHREIWKTDGTEAGTQLVAVGQHIANEDKNTIYNGKIYFFGENFSDAYLYSFDGTLISKIMPQVNSYSGAQSIYGSQNFLEFNNDLYFRAFYDYSDLEVCKITMPATSGNANLESNKTILLHPNPSNGIFSIDTDKSINAIAAFDVLGKAIGVNRLSANQFSIENKGLYFLKIEFENGQTGSSRIIIK